MSRRVRALFGAMNFWAIVMYNLVSLNSLEFTELVARRLLLAGEGKVSTPLGGQGLHREGHSLGLAQEAQDPWLCFTGFPQTTLAILFVTYCGVQLVKERERSLALEEEPGQDKEKPE